MGSPYPPACRRTRPAAPTSPPARSTPPWRRDGRSRRRQPLRLALLLGLLLVLVVGVPVLVLAIAPTARAEDWSATPGDSLTSQTSDDAGDGGLPVRQPDTQDPSTPTPAAETPDLAQATDAAQQLLTATPPQPAGQPPGQATPDDAAGGLLVASVTATATQPAPEPRGPGGPLPVTPNLLFPLDLNPSQARLRTPTASGDSDRDGEDDPHWPLAPGDPGAPMSDPPSVPPGPPVNFAAAIEPPDDPGEGFFDELRRLPAEEQVSWIEERLDEFADVISAYRDRPDSVQAREFNAELIEGWLVDYFQFIDATFIHRDLELQAAEGVLSPEQEARLRARVEDLQRQFQEVLAEEHAQAPEADEGGDAYQRDDFDYQSASVEDQVAFLAHQLSLMQLRTTALQDPWDVWGGEVPPLVLAGDMQARLAEYLEFIDDALLLQVDEGDLELGVVDELRASAEGVRRRLAEVLAEQPASRVDPDQIMRLISGLTASFLQDVGGFVEAVDVAAAEAGDRAKLEVGLQQLQDWEETVPLSPEEQGRVESLQDRIRQMLDELPPAQRPPGQDPNMQMSMVDPAEYTQIPGFRAPHDPAEYTNWPGFGLDDDANEYTDIPGFRLDPPGTPLLFFATLPEQATTVRSTAPEQPTQTVFIASKPDNQPLAREQQATPAAPDTAATSDRLEAAKDAAVQTGKVARDTALVGGGLALLYRLISLHPTLRAVLLITPNPEVLKTLPGASTDG